MKRHPTSQATTTAADLGVVVRPAPFQRDDLLLGALQSGHPGAQSALFARYGAYVRKILTRVVGVQADLDDLTHDVFVQVFRSLPSMRGESSLKTWIASVTVHVAHKAIRRARRRRWLSFFAPEDVPDPPASAVSHEAFEALAATYRVLDELADDHRIMFALRFVEGMELQEVADVCGVSLATVKRRLFKAGEAFAHHAAREPALDTWIREGARWTSK